MREYPFGVLMDIGKKKKEGYKRYQGNGRARGCKGMFVGEVSLSPITIISHKVYNLFVAAPISSRHDEPFQTNEARNN